ncbi:MAG: exosortase/archaeosortase family protein [Candidatus Binatia bacterium]
MFVDSVAEMLASRKRPQGSGRLFGGVVLLVLTVGMLYRTVLPSWLEDLWIDPNYSHGLLVPFAAAWLVYERRDRLASLTPNPAGSGGIIVLGGLALLMAGVLAAELFTTRVSMLVVITGLVSFILGYGYIRALALPLAFLLFMVPLPALVLTAIAFPLQLLASQFAVSTLQAVGVPALREGNVILLPNGALEVVEACSGLRSLVSLAATSVLISVVTLRTSILRLVVVMASVPIAVLMNGFRVSGTGVLAYHFGTGVAEGFFHTFSGWLVFVGALLVLGTLASAARRFERK